MEVLNAQTAVWTETSKKTKLPLGMIYVTVPACVHLEKLTGFYVCQVAHRWILRQLRGLTLAPLGTQTMPRSGSLWLRARAEQPVNQRSKCGEAWHGFDGQDSLCSWDIHGDSKRPSS